MKCGIGIHSTNCGVRELSVLHRSRVNSALLVDSKSRTAWLISKMTIKEKLLHACPVALAARSIRLRYSAVRLLIVWVPIPPGAWMSVCCKCCVLSGRGLCDEVITRPEEPYRLWCIVVCDLETS